MTKLLKIVGLVTLFSNILIVSGNATIYTFNDIYANWPGWYISSTDEFGNPQIGDIKSVDVTIDENNYLKSVDIRFDTSIRIPWDTGLNDSYYDSLFINSDWNGNYSDYQSWDYYVRDDTQNNNTDGTLYSVSSGYSYILAPSVSGASMRTGHPAGIYNNNYLTLVSGLSSVFWDGTNNILTYSFSDNKILMGDKFVIGWSVWCANDVFLTPVPEPGLLILLGVGLTGVGILARRYRKI